MPYKSRHTEDLLKGRVSIPGASYFLTWVTARRIPLFAENPNRQAARQCLIDINSTGDGRVLAGNVMPDHIHLLLELGARLTLSKMVAKTKSAIARTCPEVKWQRNFFEHQLRPTDSAEAYAFYIFMNPYCAGICPLDQAWPGWILSKDVRWSFEEKLKNGLLPQPEWVGQAERFGQHLPPGAD